MKFTALGMKRLTTPGRYGDGAGLWLQVRDTQRRSWLFRFTQNGRAREMGLGPFPDVSLAEARDAAAACRRQLRAGQDPIEHRKGQRTATLAESNTFTFQEVASRYVTSKGAGWRNDKHGAQWTTTLTVYAYPFFGNQPVNTIDTAAVQQALDPIWITKPETASRLRGRIQAVLDYAKAQGWRTGENPARWQGHLSNILAAPRKIREVQHHSSLPRETLPAFLAAVAQRSGTASLAIRFVVLTACRTGEAIGAKLREVDTDRAVWIVPAERMKGGREHRVPLSAPVLAILAEMHPLKASPDSFVFPGSGKSGHLSNMALTVMLRRMNEVEEGQPVPWPDGQGRDVITMHGFRSTFRDWAAEVTHYPRELAEKDLAHTLKDKTEAAYQRGDLFAKRAEMMAAWAQFCSGKAA